MFFIMQIIISSLVTLSLLSMGASDSSSQNTSHSDLELFERASGQAIPLPNEDIEEIYENDTHENNNFHDIDPDLIINNLPADERKRVTDLIIKTKLPQLRELRKTCVLFSGQPGVGKSRLAETVAFKANRMREIINGGTIANEYQNSASSHLQRIFNSVIASGRPYVVVIDELNCLTDESKNNNQQENLRRTLNAMIDRCSKLKAKNILIIGTVNNHEDLPDFIKSRFGKPIIIPTLGKAGNLQALRFFIHQKSSEDVQYVIEDNVLEAVAEKTKNLSVRNLNLMFDDVVEKASELNYNMTFPLNVRISLVHFNAALKGVDLNNQSWLWKKTKEIACHPKTQHVVGTIALQAGTIYVQHKLNVRAAKEAQEAQNEFQKQQAQQQQQFQLECQHKQLAAQEALVKKQENYQSAQFQKQEVAQERRHKESMQSNNRSFLVNLGMAALSFLWGGSK